MNFLSCFTIILLFIINSLEIVSAQIAKQRSHSCPYYNFVYPNSQGDLNWNPFVISNPGQQRTKILKNDQNNYCDNYDNLPSKNLPGNRTQNELWDSHSPLYIKDQNLTGTSEAIFNPQGVREDWIYTLDHKVSGYDWASDVAVDDSGNIYITGYTTNLPNGMDFLTIKYDSHGQELWRVNYDGEQHGDDFAKEIVIDDNNDIIIAGYGTSKNFDEDMLIVKYDSQGRLKWQAHFNSADNAVDIFHDMLVDMQGNIYLLSKSLSLVKFSPDGLQLWMNQINVTLTSAIYFSINTENSEIIIDSQQNIYITCSTEYRLKSLEQYISVGEIWIFKYDPSGNHVWTRSYSRSELTMEHLHCAGIDKFDNIFISGISWNESDWNENTTHSILVKYDSEGNLLWDKTDTYRGYNQIKLDNSGNLYRNAGINLEKYNQSGNLIWSRQIEAFDSWNWPFLGGRKIFLDIVIDSLDNIILTGVKDRNIAAAKITLHGDLSWNALYKPPDSYISWPHAFTVSKTGEVIICGISSDPLYSNHDYLTLKYDPQGNEEWNATYNGNDTQLGETYHLGLDMHGNVYLSGFDGEQKILTKIGFEGNVEWLHNNEDSYEIDMKTDGWGNCYFLYSKFNIVKRNNKGKLLWNAKYQNPLDGGYYSYGMYLDQEGNTYVFGDGYYEENEDTYVNYILVIKYDQNGILQWQERISGYSLNSYYVNSNGNVYFTGWT